MKRLAGFFRGLPPLTQASAAILVPATFGSLLGLVAGARGGLVDGALGRLVDLVLAFPGLLLAVALVVLSTNVLGDALVERLTARRAVR